MRAFRWIGREREVLAALVVQVLALLPVLRTPYRYDDTFNSAFAGGAELQGDPWVAATWEIVERWLHEQGRFFPLSGFQTYGQFVYVQSLTAYKVLLIVWVVVATVAVVALVRRLGASPALAALVAVGATLTMQIRNYHDPLIAYAGLQQAVLAYMALSGLLFHVWLRDGRRWALAGSLALIALATLTYESAPLLCGVHLVVAVAERRSAVRGLVAAMPALGVGAAFLVFSLYLRSRASAPVDAYTAVIDLPVNLRTLGNQVLGAVPLSYVGLNPGDTFVFRGELLKSMGVGSILVGVVLAVLVWWLVTRAAAEATRRPWAASLALALGVVLVLAPAAPIALAGRYQGELVAGVAYLPVFIEGFGVALIAVAVLMFVRGRVGKSGVAVGAVILGVAAGSVAAITHRANTVMADSFAGEKRAASTLRTALARGVVDEAPDGVQVFAGPMPPAWLVPGYFTMYGQARPGAVTPVAGVADARAAALARGEPSWYFESGLNHVLAGPLGGGARAQLFLAGDTGTSHVLLDATGAGSGRVLADQSGDRVVGLPPASVIEKVAFAALPPGAPFPLVGFAGCTGPDPSLLGGLWCSRQGAVGVANPGAAAVQVRLVFGISTSEEDGAPVRVRWPGGARSLRAGATPVRVSLPLEIPAQGAAVVQIRTTAKQVPESLDPRRWAVLLHEPAVRPR